MTETETMPTGESTTAKKRKAVGSRWRFESKHWSVEMHDGKVCEITANDTKPAPYTVKFNDGCAAVAFDLELKPLKGSRKTGDTPA